MVQQILVVPEAVQLPRGELAVPIVVKLLLLVLKTFKELAVNPVLAAKVEGSSIEFVEMLAEDVTKTRHFPFEILFPSLKGEAVQSPILSLIGRAVNEVLDVRAST